MSPILLAFFALVVGLLIGGLASRGADPPAGRTLAHRAVRPVARITSAFVEPAFHWLGLVDPQGKPDNSKIMYTFVVFAATAVTVHIGLEITAVTWPFIGLVVADILGAAGPRILLKALRVWRPGAYKDEDAAGSAMPATGAGAAA